MSNDPVCYAREDANTNLIYVEEFCRNIVTPVTFPISKWIARCLASGRLPNSSPTRVILSGVW